jgi:hypothetical protein
MTAPLLPSDAVLVHSKLAVATLLLAVTGCDDASDRPSDWAYVHAAILEPACAASGCHSGPTSQNGVDLSTSEAAYTVLTGRVCGAPEQPGDPVGNFVRPGHPESSRLMYMLRGESTLLMPPNLALPDAEIAVIERWILEGATCD